VLYGLRSVWYGQESYMSDKETEQNICKNKMQIETE